MPQPEDASSFIAGKPRQSSPSLQEAQIFLLLSEPCFMTEFPDFTAPRSDPSRCKQAKRQQRWEAAKPLQRSGRAIVSL